MILRHFAAKTQVHFLYYIVVNQVKLEPLLLLRTLTSGISFKKYNSHTLFNIHMLFCFFSAGLISLVIQSGRMESE